jgi:hypothetical protein
VVALARGAFAKVLEQPGNVVSAEGFYVLALRAGPLRPVALRAFGHRIGHAPQLGPELETRASQQRRDRDRLDAHHAGDLIVGEAQELTQSQRLALALGQPRRGGRQLARHRLRQSFGLAGARFRRRLGPTRLRSRSTRRRRGGQPFDAIIPAGGMSVDRRPVGRVTAAQHPRAELVHLFHLRAELTWLDISYKWLF